MKESQNATAGATKSRSAGQESACATQPQTSRMLPAQERLRWWRHARFGMFIHWGPYSILGGEWQGQRIDGGVGHGVGEWIMYNAQIPVNDYARVARTFNPQHFDADAWARLAKDTGQKYLILTTKHHDGFALFKTAASDYNICDASPFGRDIVAELAAACKRHGIRLGLYYSQAQDWYHSGGAAFNGLRDPNAVWTGGDAAAGRWDKAQDGNFDDYLQNVSLPQVRELLTAYGQVDIFWWDTPIGMDATQAQLFADLLELQPAVITNNRLLNPEKPNAYSGDTETPEQFIPATGLKGRDFEVCMTVNDTWGFKTHDHNWKPARQLIRQLVDTVSKGGNFLLNIGPDAEGRIPAPCIERMETVGRWMAANGDSIEGAIASPFAKLPWGRCTRRTEEGRELLFLQVFRWPRCGLLPVPGLRSRVLSAQLLATGAELATEITAEGVLIHVPATAPDADVSVIRLEVEAPLEVAPCLPAQDSNGSLYLPAWQADIHNRPYGTQAVLDLDADEVAIRNWLDDHTRLSWDLEISSAGTFDIFARSHPLPTAGRLQLSARNIELDAEDKPKHAAMVISDNTSATKAADDSAEQSADAAAAQASNGRSKLGTLTFATPGRYVLQLTPLTDGKWHPIDLITLEAAAASPHVEMC